MEIRVPSGERTSHHVPSSFTGSVDWRLKPRRLNRTSLAPAPHHPASLLPVPRLFALYTPPQGLPDTLNNFYITTAHDVRQQQEDFGDQGDQEGRAQGEVAPRSPDLDRDDQGKYSMHFNGIYWNVSMATYCCTLAGRGGVRRRS